jgi:hypothetical protein
MKTDLVTLSVIMDMSKDVCITINNTTTEIKIPGIRFEMKTKIYNNLKSKLLNKLYNGLIIC